MKQKIENGRLTLQLWVKTQQKASWSKFYDSSNQATYEVQFIVKQLCKIAAMNIHIDNQIHGTAQKCDVQRWELYYKY